jgi:hypothetical protein
MQLIKIIISVILISFFGSSISHAAESTGTPVMIIRFNQELIDYDKPLQKVAKSAIAAKPSVLFDIVSVVPETDSRSDNSKLKERSEFLTNQVIETLQLNGAKPEQIRTTFQNSTIAESGEVHIFVR